MSFVIHHIRIIRRMHARIGVFALFFLIFLAVSGWALNHAESLKLDQREINSPWLMHWYGIKSPSPAQGYLLGTQYFVAEGGRWVLGNKVLGDNREAVVGAVDIGEIIYVATPTALYLYLADGQLVDKVERQSLPALPILALGKLGHRIILKTPAAPFASSDGLEWQKSRNEPKAWSAPQALPDSIKAQLAAAFAPGLPAQRILLDLHSGRLFGRYGPLFVDFLAIALLTLGMSGLWIYWRSVKQGRHPHK